MKLYFFNITNLDDYLNNENAKIEVKEMSPLVFKSKCQSLKFLALNSKEGVANFRLNCNYTFDQKLMKNFDENKIITTVETKTIELLDDFPDVLRNLLNNKFNLDQKESTKNLFINLKMKDLFISENVSIYTFFFKFNF